MLAFHSDRFVVPLPPGHRFPVSKSRQLREAVAAALPQVRLVEAPAASDGEIALAHDPAWIGAVVNGTTTAAQQREIGFPWSPELAERARRSVGATIAAARAALFDDGVSVQLAGGTHHAHAQRGAGFCVFNDTAVAARLMQAEAHRRHPGRSLRVVVIDLDVHQGDGTATIFRDDPSVFTLSLHGARNFPARKAASDLDVELPDGCDDEQYLDALRWALAATWQRHGESMPGLAFYLAGADAHGGDRLGRLGLSAQGLARRDRFVFDALRERGIPVAVTMAGGYGNDMAVTVAIQCRTVAEALRAWQGWGRDR